MQSLIESLLEIVSWPVIVGSIVFYFVSVAIYRLYFHPLARFPGPKLAALTRLYEGYYDVIENGQYTFKIGELHKKYGPIIRISPHELHVNDPAFFDTLYRQEGIWHKYAWAVNAFAAYGATIFTPDHHIHKARRQPINPFFSKAKITAHQARLRFHVERMCARLNALATASPTVSLDETATAVAFDLGAATTAIARDMANEFIGGKHYDSIGAEDFDAAFVAVSQGGGSMWRTTKFVRWFAPAMRSVPPQWIMKIADPVTAQFFQFLLVNMEDTKRLMTAAVTPSDDGPNTIIHEIMNSKLPDAEKKFVRVFEDMSTISGAGFETTASVLRMIIFHVYSDPEILEYLRDELFSAATGLASVSQLDLKALEKLPYLTSVLMEGLRLSPAIATRMARVAPDRDIVYDKWSIPAGTPVGMTTILVHMDESMYPEPRRFNPDRWMDPSPWRIGNRVFVPFGKGTRNCLGMHLAWAEMYIVISTIIPRFDFKFQGVTARDLECDSDQFAIGTRGKGVMYATVSEAKL